MLADAFHQGVTCGLVVTTLDVEVTEEEFEDEWGDDGDPCLQKIDECGVGAELLQDVDWKFALEYQATCGLPSGKMTAPQPLSTER